MPVAETVSLFVHASRPFPSPVTRAARARVSGGTSVRMRVAGFAPDRDTPLIAVERRGALLPAYTAATIVAGILALVVASVVATPSPSIAIPGVAEPWAGLAGILAWTLFGLAGSLRIIRGPSGHGVLTFHLPFILAAMGVGGAAAGGWV